MIDPRGMTPVRWADQMSIILDRYGIVGILDDPKQWQDWAARVINLPGISQYDPPNPYDYDSWEEWALRFNLALDLQ